MSSLGLPVRGLFHFQSDPVPLNLGHATAAFTLDVYGHVTDSMKQESAARMEKFIQSVSGE